MEETYALKMNKALANKVINQGLKGKFDSRITFLRQIDIFKEVDTYILLPIASNIQVKRYRLGEYLVKAGELPEGLIIVKEGSCIVCAEKLALRTNKPSEYSRINPLAPNVKTNPTGSSSISKNKEESKSKSMKSIMIKGNAREQDSTRYYSDSLS